MPDIPDALLVIDVLARHFDALEIPYFVGGSVASSMHGIFRATNDVDVVVALTKEKVDSLAAMLEAEFYIDADAAREAVRSSTSFNVIHLPTMVKADLFVPEPLPFRQSVWSRRRREQLRPESEAIYVASPEDMVLQKLEWYRLTGERSDRQWGDVLGILKVQGAALDFGYVRHWAAELGLTALYDAALDDAGLAE